MRNLTIPEDKASDLFPPLAYEDGTKTFLMGDKSIGFGFVCVPLQGFDEKAGDRINVLLNGDFPDDTLMNFCLFGSPDIAREMDEMHNLRQSSAGETLRRMAEQRAAFLQQGTANPLNNQMSSLVRNFWLMITIKIPIQDAFPTKSELSLCQDLQQQFRASLSTVGLRPTDLVASEYVRLMNTMLNWGDGATWRNRRYFSVDEDRTLNKQIVDYDNWIDVDQNGVSLGDACRVRSLSVKQFPKYFNFGAAGAYLGDLMTGSRGIRENCAVSATIHFPAPHKAKAAMERKRQWAVNQAYGPLLKFVPLLAAKKHGYDNLFEALDDGDRIVRLHLGMLVFAKNESQAIAASSSARSYWGELGFSMMEDKFFNLPLMLNKLPFCAERNLMRDSFRYKSMGTRHAITMIPIYGDWRGTGSPVLHTLSRNGQLMRTSLFDSSSNYNCTIAAQSGSGKSFLTNDMILNTLALGGKCWVIDVGRSYEDLSEFLDGDFIEFSNETQICLNPFPLIHDYSEAEDVLLAMLEVMAAPTEKLSDFQAAKLKKIMKGVWQDKGKGMLIDDIAQASLGDDDRRIRDIGHQLYPFTSHGEYGRYFVGANNIRFDNPLTVLELEELKGRAHLQQVVLLQLIYNIQNEMYLGVRDRPKIVFIDEAWSLLTGDSVASFIEHGFRRFRKYGGAAVVITQSVQDLYGSKTGEAIARNSANMYLLGQKSADIAQLEKDERLPLGAGGYQLLKSVHTSPGHYSEIFFMTEYGAGIGRLVVDEFTQLLYSTKPEDVNAIRTLRKQGMSAAEAIKQILRERGKGDGQEVAA